MSTHSPGDALDLALRQRGWTAEDLARLSGLPLGRVLCVLGSQHRIDLDTAFLIGKVLGTGATYWLDLDRAWRTVWRR